MSIRASVRAVRSCLAASLFVLLAIDAKASQGPASGPPNSAPVATPNEDAYAESRKLIGDIARIVTPNGVDETFVATLGGARQVVNVRGADRANPILVFVHGGPGSVEMPMAWTFQRPWEDFFTVVQYDQRGAGRSYPLNDPEVIAPTLTLERYRDDAIELIELLRARYGQDKVVLLGHSWGSAVGVAVAAKRPDLLHVYVGTGQLIDLKDNERAGMAWTVQRARERGDAAAAGEVLALAPYPDAGPFTIDKADGWRKHAFRYGGFAAGRPDGNFYLRAPRLSPLYTPADRKAWADGSAFTITTLWPRLQDLSHDDVRTIRTPVFLFLGRHDAATPSTIAASWMSRLQAPRREIVWFENSAHLPFLEEPGLFLKALLDNVRPLTRTLDRPTRESASPG